MATIKLYLHENKRKLIKRVIPKRNRHKIFESSCSFESGLLMTIISAPKLFLSLLFRGVSLITFHVKECAGFSFKWLADTDLFGGAVFDYTEVYDKVRKPKCTEAQRDMLLFHHFFSNYIWRNDKLSVVSSLFLIKILGAWTMDKRLGINRCELRK